MTHNIYTVFGNRVRVNLLLCLGNGAKNVSELIHTCGLAQSAVSQHLKKLKAAGVVSTQRQGKEILYILKYKKAEQIAKLLTELQKEVV